MAGELDPADVDKKEKEILQKQKDAADRKAKKLEDQERSMRKMKRDRERKKWGFMGRWWWVHWPPCV